MQFKGRSSHSRCDVAACCEPWGNRFPRGTSLLSRERTRKVCGEHVDAYLVEEAELRRLYHAVEMEKPHARPSGSFHRSHKAKVRT